MDKRVILAVAGAGKTYHICHTINSTSANLILAYTNENIHNIERELCDAYGNVPASTTVMTFDSFVYQLLVLPYEPTIGTYFKRESFKSSGICMIDPPEKLDSKTKKPNPKYVTKDKLEHYITQSNQYYCARLSELVLQVQNNQKTLIQRAAEKLNIFYDYVLIDEFQDFREYDYELIISLSKVLSNVLLVGDYFQHSVSATNNSGKPFKRKGKDVSYNEFIELMKSKKFIVDIDTLNKSRRCSPEVCDYIKMKLGINIIAYDNHSGRIIWADSFAKEILDNENILKLVFNNSAKYTFSAMNWSYSKGDTVDVACVILTTDFENMDRDTFSLQKISILTKNKLYVAMTRSRGDLYLIKASTFKNLRHSYLKELFC